MILLFEKKKKLEYNKILHFNNMFAYIYNYYLINYLINNNLKYNFIEKKNMINYLLFFDFFKNIFQNFLNSCLICLIWLKKYSLLIDCY